MCDDAIEIKILIIIVGMTIELIYKPLNNE